MPAYRLFIELSSEAKVTTNYKWSACLCLQRSQPLHWLCQQRITLLTFSSCVWDGESERVNVFSFFYCWFCFISVRVCPCFLCLHGCILCVYVCVFLSDSISSHSGRTFRSLAFCAGLTLIATLRLLLLLPYVICFNLSDVWYACVCVCVC